MEKIRNEKLIVLTIVVGFILAFIINISAAIIYPPDFSGEFPIYTADWAMIVQLAGAFYMIALTVAAMKAEEEKQILAAAGFTANAISFGIALLILFDIAEVANFEQYERYYRVSTAASFLAIPSFILIASYSKFKKWVRYFTLFSVTPFIISSILFLYGNRDYKLLESIMNVGVTLFSFCWLLWGGNIYVNYRNINKS
jgi:hypothetical protein